MPLQFYIRVIRRDGTTRNSSLFDSLEEADRWRQTTREDPLILAAVIVQVESSKRVETPPPG
jgi:hypothetical protein